MFSGVLCLSTLLSYLLWVVIPPVVVDVRSPNIHFNTIVSKFLFVILLLGLVCLVRVLSFFASCLPLLWIPCVCAFVFVNCRVCGQDS